MEEVAGLTKLVVVACSVWVRDGEIHAIEGRLRDRIDK
jgi:hypothetical protein